jgi:BirA family biotin operon repressor/biotin-[acetyl-CoA-carboxylase] ligase
LPTNKPPGAADVVAAGSPAPATASPSRCSGASLRAPRRPGFRWRSVWPSRALTDLCGGTQGARNAALKWPNDILKDGRKLGGILVELQPGAPHAAVIGIGLNLHLAASMPDELRAASAALDLADADPNVLYASLLSHLLERLEQFAGAGFAPMREAWTARHAFQDAAVVLSADFGAPRQGICRGVDTDGALLLESDGRIERVLSGEVSLRPA